LVLIFIDVTSLPVGLAPRTRARMRCERHVASPSQRRGGQSFPNASLSVFDHVRLPAFTQRPQRALAVTVAVNAGKSGTLTDRRKEYYCRRADVGCPP